MAPSFLSNESNFVTCQNIVSSIMSLKCVCVCVCVCVIFVGHKEDWCKLPDSVLMCSDTVYTCTLNVVLLNYPLQYIQINCHEEMLSILQ